MATRRAVISAVFILLLCTGRAIGAEPSTTGVAAKMAEAAQKFLAALDEKSRATATMDFDNPARLDWHNIPKPTRKGLQFKDMTSAQRELCQNLVKTALSDLGYAKACKIMSLENNVREGEKKLPSPPLRDQERYFLTIFGEPSAHGAWGWSFEGHHLSFNFVIRDGNVVSETPSFWGANPATISLIVPGGPEMGTRTLADEEQRGFDLVNALTDAQRGKAMIAEKAPADYRAAGKPQPPTAPAAGILASEMTDAEKKILLSVLQTYSDHLTAELSAAQMAQINADGLDQIHFAWAGGIKPTIPHYFRVQGPSFVLELVNFQSDPAGNPANHIHSVWRNMHGDFDVPIK